MGAVLSVFSDASNRFSDLYGVFFFFNGQFGGFSAADCWMGRIIRGRWQNVRYPRGAKKCLMFYTTVSPVP